MITLNTQTPIGPSSQNVAAPAPHMSNMQPGSQYQGTPLVHTGDPVQQGPQVMQPYYQGHQQPATGHHMQGGTVNVTRQHHTGAESQTMESVPTAQIPSDKCARVSIGMGFTKNLGDYQSFKATVSVELPCPVDQVQAGLDAAQQIARDRMYKLWNEG